MKSENKTPVTKIAALTLASAFVFSLAACSSSSSTIVPEATSEPMIEDDFGLDVSSLADTKFGIGIAVTAESGESSGSLSKTTAAVIVGKDGTIYDCRIDTIESKMSLADGVLTLPESYISKRELGEDYGMKAASSIGKEWYEQVDAFSAYIQGKTYEEVMQIAVDENGKATEADLAAGCTISILDFQKAIEKACSAATAISTEQFDAAYGTDDMYNEDGLYTGDMGDDTGIDGENAYAEGDLAQDTLGENDMAGENTL